MAEVAQVDAVSQVIAAGIVAVVDRVISRRAQLKDPLALKIDYMEKRLEEVKRQESQEAENQTSLAPSACITGTCNGYSPRQNAPEQAAPSENSPAASVEGPTEGTQKRTREEVAVGCLPCARGHLATVSGTLKESLRFARDEGIAHPEVQTRLQTAEEELTVLERHDWTPEKIANSPAGEREVIQAMLSKLRVLRQDLSELRSYEDLEKATAIASNLDMELRMRVLKNRGFSEQQMGSIVSLAQKVQNGELTMEQAKEQVRMEYGKAASQ